MPIYLTHRLFNLFQSDLLIDFIMSKFQVSRYQQQSLRYYFCNFIRKICIGLCFRLFCTKTYTLLPPYFTWAWLLIIWIQPASFTWTRTTTNASYHCWSYMEQSVLWIRHVVYIWYQQSFFTWYEWIYLIFVLICFKCTNFKEWKFFPSDSWIV